MKFKIRFKFRERDTWNDSVKCDLLSEVLGFIKILMERTILTENRIYIQIIEYRE